MTKEKPILIVIGGPTAAGKTDAAIALAQYFGTEILSFDSRQFYHEMKIGTAPPSTEQLALVPHHFIHHLSVEDDYDAGRYAEDAMSLLKSRFAQKKVMIAVGGSGLYIDALIHGLDDLPPGDPEVRNALNARFESEGLGDLLLELSEVDPVAYALVDKKNPRRVLRALEVSLVSGKPYSSFLGKKKHERPFSTLSFVLSPQRQALYERINQRVLEMFSHGLLEEARALYVHKNCNALNTVGYSELFEYFEDELSLEEAIEEIQKNTRRFAKRQITWFKKNKDWHWMESFDLEKVLRIPEIKSLT